MTSYEKKRKRILKRVFVFLTLFVLVFAVVGIFQTVLGEAWPFLLDANPLVWIFVTSFLVALGYQPVDQVYTWLFRHVLFPRRSRIVELLHQLAEELAQTQDFTELANLVVNTLGEIFQLKTVSLLVRHPQAEGFVIGAAYGWNPADYRRVKLANESPLIEWLRASGPDQIILRSRANRSLSWAEANKLTKDFDLLRTVCMIPLWTKRELLGTVNLSSPTLEEELDEGDLRFFRDFGRTVVPSVAYALEIQRLRLENEELRDAQSKLLQTAKLTAIERLATGIAHEIHNPLTIISGKAQVLLLQKDQQHYDESVEEVLKTIVKQTRRAADVTKKLLMFSQARGTSQEKIRLEAMVEDTLSLIGYRTSLEGIEIQRLVGQDLPDFFGNVQELREVFFNLILNAVQAVDAGGRIQIGITFEKADKVFVIQVADSGPGIAREHLDQVFNPFFTTRPEGMGLGLFVTQQIVRRYGGSVRAESQPGEGTIFVVELPWRPAEEEEIPPEKASVFSLTGGKDEDDSAAGRG